MSGLLGSVPAPAWAAGVVLLAAAAAAGWISVAEPPVPREFLVALPPAAEGAQDSATSQPVDVTGESASEPATPEPAVPDVAPKPPLDAGDGISAVAPPLPLAEHESVIESAASRVPAGALERATELVPVPHPDLIEESRVGLLPRVGPDGSQPWQVYARPFDDSDPRPRIAIVIESLGMRRSTTFQAIGLGGEVTLAFAPYANGLGNWIDLAREGTHEILLELPMEPRGYPRDDPGPRALLTGLDAEQNLERLEWLLGRFVGYVGVMPFQGTAFTEAPAAFGPVVASLRDRGLLYVDHGARDVARTVATESGLHWVGFDLRLDATPSRETIAAALAEAERIANERQSAVIVGQPLPLTLTMIEDWLPGLAEREIAVAPLTAVFARRASE